MSDKKYTNPLKSASESYKDERPASRRRIVPSKPDNIDLTVVPQLDVLMNDALSIIGAELSQYQSKTKRGITLDLKEARAIQGYLDTLVKLSKESREQARAQDLSDLSDEELVQLAAQLAKSGRSKPSEEAE